MAGDQYDSIEALINEPESRRAQLKEYSSRLGGLFNRDRSKIARWIIILYVTVIIFYVLYLLYRGLFCGIDVSDNFSELLKIAILPIVTLVIGFYFGSKQAE